MMPLWMRIAVLTVLVVLFQYVVARFSVERETKRRFQHALTGHALVQISHVLPSWEFAVILLATAALAVYVLRTYFFSSYLEAFGPILRPDEILAVAPHTDQPRLPGAFYFLIGTCLTVWGCGWRAAAAATSAGNRDGSNDDDGWTVSRYAVECLAIADPMASWVGTVVPSPRINGRTSVSGSVACFVTAWGVGYVMLMDDDDDDDDPHKHHHHKHLWTITVGAAACAIAEALPLGNDNLNIPLLTALAVTGMRR